ncbi:MAG: MXAN_5187 C-terminal domain-containing protein [Candidatus Polarisedimenticolia bacterium]
MTFEEELRRIDEEIRKLKIQFDLFFIGTQPKPPTDQRDALEKLIKRHQASSKTVAERFLYNAVVNKFNTFSELWLKSLRAREEGARVHPLAARHAQQAAAQETGGTNRPNGGAAGAGARSARAGRHPHHGARAFRISTTAQDDAALRALYQDFVAAKTRAGDPKQPSFDAFAREIARHAATLRGKVACEAIDFTIHSSDNKVSIKGKPSR